MNCDRCGQEHVRDDRPTCKGHTRRDGVLTPCKNYPMHDQQVCKFHGGNSRQARAAAAERANERHMQEVLRLVSAEVDPEHLNKSADEQLLEEVGRSAQIVQWLAHRVAELNVPNPAEDGNPFEQLLGVDEDGNPLIGAPRFQLYGPDHNGDLGIHPLWDQLNRERERHARMAKLAIDAGISERLVRLAEAQGQQIVALILDVINALDLTDAQRTVARKIAAQRLRAIGPTGGVLDTTAREA